MLTHTIRKRGRAAIFGAIAILGIAVTFVLVRLVVRSRIGERGVQGGAGVGTGGGHKPQGYRPGVPVAAPRAISRGPGSPPP